MSADYVFFLKMPLEIEIQKKIMFISFYVV